MDGGAWWATVHGVTKSQTQLSDFTFTSVYMSIPISQFIPLPTFPPGNSKFVFYICDSISVLSISSFVPFFFT